METIECQKRRPQPKILCAYRQGTMNVDKDKDKDKKKGGKKR